jgi:hypothetical protein
MKCDCDTGIHSQDRPKILLTEMFKLAPCTFIGKCSLEVNEVEG